MKKEPHLKHNSILAVTALSAIALGFLDYVTGYELDFFPFYFAPIAIAGWKVGTPSYSISILSSVIWLFSDFLFHPYSSVLSAFCTAMMRVLSFMIVAHLTSKIHFLLAKERETPRDRLSRVKTLSGLIPICAGCNKIRDDKGNWQRVEEYVEERTNAQFTHGLCPGCVNNLLKEARIDNSPEPAGPQPKTAVSNQTFIRRRSFRGRSPRVGFK